MAQQHSSNELTTAPTTDTSSVKQREVDDNGSARVLMIDDSKAICIAVKSRLSSERNIGFAAVHDPRVGLEAAREYAPTVILLDLEMPKMSGLELLQVLRADPATAEVPIIMLSGTDDPAVKAQAFTLGANDYAEKQMNAVELNTRIEYHTRAYLTSQRLQTTITQLQQATERLERQSSFIRKTFGRYLSDEVVDQLLETPEGLELGGEKRVLSILMADLRGFTSMSEQLAPEDLLAIVNNFLQVMTEILLKYHGTIDEFIGDAILAIFGAPEQRADDACRALACALEMQLAMSEVNAFNRSRGFPEIAMGIGINTGEVVVGNIGSERRSKYGVVGSEVNLTARIESYTSGGQILVSQSTVDACGCRLRVDQRLDVHPKGIAEQITIFEIGGIDGAYTISID